MESFEESGCKFILRQNSRFIKLDNTEEYSKVSQFLSCVEGILVINDKTYFIEIKRYDYFAKKKRNEDSFDKKISETLTKIIDKISENDMEFIKNCVELVKEAVSKYSYEIDIDERFSRIIKKLVDSYFIMIFINSNNEDLKNISNLLKKNDKLFFALYICPSFNQELEKDRKNIIKEILQRRIKNKIGNLKIELLVDTEDNNFKLFEKIEGLNQ